MHGRRATLAIHGIWNKTRELNWTELFEHEARHELDVRPRIYGWASGALSYFSWYRNHIVNVEEDYALRILVNQAPANIIAHSFGGYIAWALMAERGIAFHNVILLAPAAPEQTNWTKFQSCFKRVRVYSSLRDEIIGYAAYGKMGKLGPQLSHPRVESVKTNFLHGDLVQHERFKEYVEFLRQR